MLALHIVLNQSGLTTHKKKVLPLWIKIVGNTYGDYSSQTVELILWKRFRSKKTLSSKTLIYKYWNCILRLRLKIVKENHTLFSVQTHLGQIRRGSAPHAPGSACKLWKESGIWSFHIILDDCGKIDSSVKVAFRLTFHLSLLLTKWTIAIYRRLQECFHKLITRAGKRSILSLWRRVFYRSTSLNKFIRVALCTEKSYSWQNDKVFNLHNFPPNNVRNFDCFRKRQRGR